MLEEIGGLPAHPLMVHVPVVLLPLSLVGAIVMALRPRLVRSWGPVVTVLAGVGFLGTLLAASSGEELQEQYESTGMSISETLRDHGEMGESVRLLALVFFLALLAWVLVVRWRERAGEAKVVARLRKPRAVVAGLVAVTLVLGGVTTTAMVVTAHNGAKSVWDENAP